MLENTFQTILVISVIGVLLTGILLAIKYIFKRRFSAGWFYYIWLLVLVAMIVPVKVNWKDIQSSPLLSVVVRMADEYLPIREIKAAGDALRFESKAMYDEAGHRLLSRALLDKRIREIRFEQNLYWLSMTWIIGAVVAFELRLASYLYYLGKIRRTTKVCHLPQLAEYTNRKVIVRQGEWIPSPMLLGIFRPTLLMPMKVLTEEQLHNVLAHEMTHLNRNDMLVKWFMVLVKSVHWFNPLVYWLEKQVEQECEISCDIAVTARMNAAQKKSYADTILLFLMGKRRREFSLSMGMAGPKGLLKKRFLHMKNAKSISIGMRICSVVMTVVLLTIGAAVSGNMMNRAFPYTGASETTGDKYICTDCNVRTVYQKQEQIADYVSSTKPGWYLVFTYECPKCGSETIFRHFVREFLGAEWDEYEKIQQETRKEQEDKWWQKRATIQSR